MNRLITIFRNNKSIAENSDNNTHNYLDRRESACNKGNQRLPLLKFWLVLVVLLNVGVYRVAAQTQCSDFTALTWNTTGNVLQTTFYANQIGIQFPLPNYVTVKENSGNGASITADATHLNFYSDPSNTSVFSIVGSNLTIKAVGQATIYAEFLGNSVYCPSLPVPLTITVLNSLPPSQYTITASAGTGGKISPSSATVNSGGNQIFAFSPNTGYVIGTVIVDGVATNNYTTYSDGSASYAFSNVTSNHTITVSFVQNTPTPSTYTISASVVGTGGGIQPTDPWDCVATTMNSDGTQTSATVNSGGSVIYGIYPYNNSYSIGTLKVDGVAVTNYTTVTSSDGNYYTYPFPNVTANHTITVTFVPVTPLSSQTITWNQPLSATYGDQPITLNATASSGLPITYFSNNTSVATVTGNVLTIVGIGNATIIASQAGNANYNPADDVTNTIMVTAPMANQSITWNQTLSSTYGDPPVTLSATSSSGLAVTYTSNNTNVATISGNTLTIVGVGTATIIASQTGNKNFNPATNVEKTITVNKANQSITWIQPLSATYGDPPVTLNDTVNSGLPVTYASSNTSVATVSGNALTIVGAGATTITESQAGNTAYNQADDVTQTLTVNKANQFIFWNQILSAVYGDPPITLDAAASSNLQVTYASSNTSVATVNGNMLTIVGAGTATITASQTGNTNYNGAANATNTITVSAKK